MAFGFAKTAPCPYCYAQIDPSKAWYRCRGEGAPGRSGCTEKTDPERKRIFSDETPVRPSFAPTKEKDSHGRPLCPACKGWTGTRVCSNCHSVLPSGFGSDSPLFGIVGVRGSGKTVMLTVLSRELQDSVPKRLAADASINAIDSPLLRTLELTRKKFEGGSASLPTQTQAQAASTRDPAVFSLDLSIPGPMGLNRRVSTVLSFYDTAGESLSTADRARDVRYLGATTGVVLLLNPFAFAANRATGLSRGVPEADLETDPRVVLQNITDVLRENEHLKPGKKIKKPIAVVLAMIDAFFDEVGPDSPIRRPSPTPPWFDEGESQEVHEYVAGLIAKWGGDGILRLLEAQYQDYRFFVASALGAEPDYRTRVTSSRGIQPHRVTEPLLWLMAGRSLIPAGGS